MDGRNTSESEKFYAAVIHCNLASSDIRSREEELLGLAKAIATGLRSCIRVRPFQSNSGLGIRATRNEIDQLPFILSGEQICDIRPLGECHSNAQWGTLINPPEEDDHQPTSIRLDRYQQSSENSEVA